MGVDYVKAPFPWFGGKSKAASAVWDLLGDVPHYVEPFAGSLAVLLRRPHLANRTYFSETVGDLDGFVVNFWRATQLFPVETATAASWPVAEADLTARHLALVRWREDGGLDRLKADPMWCDPLMAGWWVWGLCCWIGSGWCAGTGPWHEVDGRLVKQPQSRKRGEPGVSQQLPHVSDNGRGVNHAGTREPGVGEFHPIVMPELVRWIEWLSARLRHVRIVHGPWTRTVTTGASLTLPVRQGKGPCGVFLDPPYADTANRADGLYAVDCLSVAHDVVTWAIEHGNDPRYRIVVAGYDAEHGDRFATAGWSEHEWFKAGHLTGGYGGGSKGGHQQHRERLWASPHCVQAATPDPEPDPEQTLFTESPQ